MGKVAIVSIARTPIGKFLGSLSKFSVAELGAIAIKGAIDRCGINPMLVDEVIMGNVLSAGTGQAPARQASLKAGLSDKTSALTINKVCGSGLKAVMLGAATIKAGDASVVVAGGMESMTNAPYLIRGMRSGVKLGQQTMIDSMIHDGLWDVYHNEHMGNFAEYTAKKSGITREEQDRYAVESQRKAVTFKTILGKEIVPLTTNDNQLVLTEDEGPRSDTTIEKLQSLRPAFTKDGSVTAANSSTLNDGAAALVLMSLNKAKELKIKPLATIDAYTTVGVPPKDIFFAPSYAIEKIITLANATSMNDFDLVEINEAFAAQVLANIKYLNIDKNRLNIYGGAIALGHPIGASGARILVTLVNALQTTGGKRGIATLCLGGGNAVAIAITISN
jgi:acetyl-CoA C-acetyltransferase